MTITPHESALLAAAEAMRDAEIGYSINLTRLVDRVAEHTAMLPDGSTHVFPTSAAASEFVERERNLAKAKTAVEAYLVGIGGMPIEQDRVHYAEGVAELAMKHRNEAEAALALVVEYDELLHHWEGEQQVLLEGDVVEIDHAYDKMISAARSAIHASPLIAGKGDGWEPIETAPKDGTHILLYAPVREFRGEPVAERLTYGYWDTPEHGAYLGDCGGDCRCPEYDDAPDPYWFSEDGGFTEEHPPTHWRPLPTPPSIPSDEGSEKP